MDKIRQSSIGVDVAKDSFVAQVILFAAATNQQTVGRSRKFDNTPAGFESFRAWIEKHSASNSAIAVVMEATGVYHESLAYDLHEHGYRLSVVLANTVKAFARSINEYSKTDSIDAKVLALMGGQLTLSTWTPASSIMGPVKSLTRERKALVKEKTRVHNRRHAESCKGRPNAKTIERQEAMIAFINSQIAAIDKDVNALIKQDPKLEGDVKRLRTIPGVGPITAVAVLAETDGFQLFEKRGQLISFAGLDVVYKQSGTSVNGKTHISKRGSSHLRGALYMPSLQAKKHGIFKRVYDRVHLPGNPKKRALVAVQRKLLLVMFALYRNGTTYQANHARQMAA